MGHLSRKKQGKQFLFLNAAEIGGSMETFECGTQVRFLTPAEDTKITVR